MMQERPMAGLTESYPASTGISPDKS